MYIAVSLLMSAAALISCNGNGGSMSVNESDTLLSVDNLLSDPLAFVDDTVRVNGTCAHLCAHGGTKAFLEGDSAGMTLRCQATPSINGAFSPDCPGHRMMVRGVLREDRVGRAEIDSLEREYMLSQEREAAEGVETKAQEGHCNADARAKGMDSLSTVEQRLAKMRRDIDERLRNEGKDYLSYFYLETLSYEVRE